MSKKSPHLPPKACRVDTYYRLQSLRWFLLFIFVAALTGVATALASVTWLAPNFHLDNSFRTVNFESKNIFDLSPDPFLVRQTEQKLIKVYNKANKINDKFYGEGSFIAQAVLISSDGWSVLYQPDYKFGEEKKWDLVDYQGLYHEVEKVVFDNETDLLYVKVEGQGFRIASFADSGDVNLSTFLWAVDEKKWINTIIDGVVSLSKSKNFPIWQAQQAYKIDRAIDKHMILLDDKGELVGFVAEDGMVISGLYVEEQIVSLLDSHKIIHKKLPLSGYFVNAIENEEKEVWQEISGFYIIDSNTKVSSSTVGVGDLIVKINNDSFTKESLFEQVLQAPEEVSLTVLRDSKEVDILAKKLPF